MSIKTKLEETFFAFGWLTAAILPILELTGRGVFNSVAAIYIAWGLAALMPSRFPADKVIKLCLLAIMASFALGIFTAHDVMRASKAWFRYGFMILSLFYTLAALRRDAGNLRKLCTILGVVGLLVPIVLVVKTVLVTGGEAFIPKHQLQERNMPFLLPFCFLLVFREQFVRYRTPWFFGLSAIFLVVILLSAGRSALLGFCAAVLIFGFVLYGKRLFLFVLPLIAIAVASLTLFFGPQDNAFFRNAEHGSSIQEQLNQLSSGRLDLWLNAIEHPPQNPLIGVGMGNARYAEKVITISAFRVVKEEVVRYQHKVRHLHNYLFDTWYETGFLGLFCLVGLFVVILGRAISRAIAANGRNDLILWTTLASVFALLVAGLLSFSYTSNQLTIYLFMLFGMLLHLVEVDSGQGNTE